MMMYSKDRYMENLPTVVALQRDAVVASKLHKEVLAGIHSTCWE